MSYWRVFRSGGGGRRRAIATVGCVVAIGVAGVFGTGGVVDAGRAAAAPLGSSGSGSTGSSDGTDTFYRPPAGPLPDAGTLLRTQSMSTFVTVPNRAGRIPASATKIMYVSTNGLGKKVAVSGYYLQPSRPWTGPGSRPLVSYGPGAHGMGDQCAPSRLVSAPNLAFPGGPMAEIEALITYNLLSRGYGVVSTDYIGLGTPGDHTFAMRVDQGDAVIDAARAALQLPGVNPHTKVALAGYSQGGAATAAAAELIDRYAPELARQVVGIYAGGAPTDLRSLLNHLDGQRLGGTIGWAIDGAMALYPDMAQKIPPLLNPEGKRIANLVRGQCILATTALGSPKSSTWTVSGKTIGEIIDSTPALAERVNEQKVGMSKPTDIPILLSSNPVDPTVPISQGQNLFAEWCGKQPRSLEYRTITFPVLGGTAMGHIAGGVAGYNEAYDWLADRFAGKAPASGCVRKAQSNGLTTGSAGSSGSS
ncbi:putative lipase [Gordonia aichiensis NBRC 108223]|uniref:Putative lipase n=1 Tax=Gordonia aichiensis NBRC 108223 TaxID=1220583 RepID=L7KG38_9ACTN|nr:putative lipase [Gordonia aichiensis NBRC 108223]